MKELKILPLTHEILESETNIPNHRTKAEDPIDRAKPRKHKKTNTDSTQNWKITQRMAIMDP